ncbi:hypothetical protein [Dongia sp.]|uniref:hypothetical protein n=1 Tax=Dongia sp. TaxID=1977262 RepID=UPI0035B45ECC
MGGELDDLRQRVAAARDRLASDVDLARKVELRLNDLARIVEGSLARQASDLDSARQQIDDLGSELERALARAEQAIGEAARADRLAKENGELRSMVMTLLEVIEGRQKSSLTSVMQKLEENVSALVSEPAAAPSPTEEIAEAEPQESNESAPETTEPEDESESADAAIPLEVVGGPEPESDPMDELTDVALEESATPLEDLSEIALYDAADEVKDPAKND